MHAEVFAGGFGASSRPRSAYPQLQGQPFHACHRCSKAAPAARQIHRICPSKGFALCFTFEARCEAAQTGQPSFKVRPVYAAVRARLVTRLRVNRFLLFDVCRSTPLFLQYILLFFAAEYSIKQGNSSLYIHSLCSYMYNPLFKEPCTNPKEPRLFRFVSGWSCCSGAAAISHRQGADEISFYFVSPYKIKEAKAKTKRGETFCKLREHQNYRHLLMKNVWFSPIILHKSVIGCDDDPSSHPMDTCHGN